MTGHETRLEPAGGEAPGSSRPTVGSLCTGYGGMEMALAEVLDHRLAWVADPDPGAAAVLAHHQPDIPNLGDITAIDWASVPPVDILAAGWPCTDISYAGLGAGIVEGNRSGLWYAIARAVGILRPRLLILENVAGIVSRRPGLDVVLADLAALGFDAEWVCVRASDVGAPHRRERWFLLAWIAGNPYRLAGQTRSPFDRRPGTVDEPGQIQRAIRPDRISAADSAGNGRHTWRPEPAGQQRRPHASVGGASAADSARGGDQNEQGDHCPQLVGPQPGAGGGNRAGANPARTGGTTEQAERVAWGPYGPAVHRWAAILGRTAPAPTEPGARGNQRLSPVFVEWLMGLSEGWVTAVPGLSQNDRLRLLGNGIVPRQGAHAIRSLMAALTEEAVA